VSAIVSKNLVREKILNCTKKDRLSICSVGFLQPHTERTQPKAQIPLAVPILYNYMLHNITTTIVIFF